MTSGRCWWWMRGAAPARSALSPKSMTLEMFCHTAVMMRGPPPAPASMNSWPLLSSTIVGDIDDSMRLPGSILLAAPWTRPNTLGVPGLDVKSSISLFSRKPATVTPLPNDVLSVVVIATAMPLASTVQRLVVWSPSSSDATSRDGVALSVIVANSLSRYAREVSLAIGMSLTNAGSPRSSLRAANARRQTSTSQCTCSAPYHGSLPTSSLPSMPAVIATTMPPDNGGG